MKIILNTLFYLVLTLKAFAVRPFITDDARIVGRRLGQYETWLRFDKHAYQHWNMIAYGPTERWEFAIGFVQGLEASKAEHKAYSYAIPLLQAKYLIKEYKPNKAPGLAIAVGTFLPGGQGAFKAPGPGAFAYLATTQSLGREDQFLFHANLGINSVQYPTSNYSVTTWGIGTQIRTIGGLHLVGEVFSGDPYVPGSGMAFQSGFRYFVSNFVQLDFTIGQGIMGENQMPFWGGAGIRLVTDWFEKKHKTKQRTS